MKDFRCPKCASPYFGRDVVKDKDGKPAILPTVRCHRCGWLGEWKR